MEKNSFRAIDFFIVIFIICAVFIGIYFVKNLIFQSQTKALILQIKKYDTAINSFTQKYHGLPGDLKNTKKFGITKKNTDGNGNNIINDRYDSLTFANGEITSFWMHLSKSKMLDENYDGKESLNAKKINTFPLSKVGENTGIIVYGDGIKTYYQVGYDYASQDRIYMKDRSLKTKEAFLIDKKIDNGNPLRGRVVVAGGGFPNNIKNSKCVDSGNYKIKNPSPACQLRIEVK